MRTVEIHVPISPTPQFFNRMHYLAASLAVHGRLGRTAKIVVTVGDDSEPAPVELGWTRHYPIEFRWVERALYRRHSYFATRLARFTHDFECDVVLMLDSDVIAVGPVDDLVELACASGSFLGVVAHSTPVRGTFTWEGLFEAAGLDMPERALEHSGFGLSFDDPTHKDCPAYFNLGMLAAPAEIMHRMGSTIFSELEIAERFHKLFRAQPSVTLALYRHGIPWKQVSERYNFPNDMQSIEKFPEEFRDMRLAHYLRYDNMHRENDFASPDAVGSLIAREDLDAVNRAMTDRLRPVHDRVLRDLAPPPRATAAAAWNAMKRMVGGPRGGAAGP